MSEPMLLTAVAMPFWVTAVSGRLFQHRRYGLWSASVLVTYPMLMWSLQQTFDAVDALMRALACVAAVGAVSAACGIAYRRHQSRIDAESGLS